MKRNLLLTVDFPPDVIGGVSAWAHDLATSLVQDGADISVLARRKADTRQHDEAFPCRVRRVRGRSWNKWQSLWMRIAAGNECTPDTTIIAATWRLATRLITPIERGGSRLAVAFHGSEITHLETATDDLRRVIDSAHALLPVSEFLKGELTRLGVVTADDPRLHVLPMPLDTNIENTAERGQDLVCIARPTELKGTDRAVRLARATGRTLHLIGPDTAPEGCIAHGLVSRNQAMALLEGAAACVLLPRTLASGLGAEGLGLALLEAAARGVPSIGCATGGVPEAIGPGLLLSDPDKPDGVLVNHWLDDPERGQAAREWVRQAHGPDPSLQVLRRALP